MAIMAIVFLDLTYGDEILCFKFYGFSLTHMGWCFMLEVPWDRTIYIGYNESEIWIYFVSL